MDHGPGPAKYIVRGQSSSQQDIFSQAEEPGWAESGRNYLQQEAMVFPLRRRLARSASLYGFSKCFKVKLFI
jgi:hypothetical protein